MDLAQSHIEKDSQNLKEEWQQVTEAIDQQTTEDAAERDRAAKERAALDEEIQELERRLAQKLEQRKTLTEVIDSCDIRISCIRSKFEKQLGRLEGKQKRLEEAQKEVEVDSQQVCQMEAELQKDREALREQELQHQQQMRDIRRASRELQKQRCFLSGIIQRRVVWQRLMEPHRESLHEARQKWEETTQRCMELSTSSASQEAAAAKLRSQIDATVEVLPSLEAEKKLAVASRSFKEAGRLTEEIRRREEGKKKIEAELESLQAGLATAREELASCRRNEQDAQEELLRVEGKCAIEELRVLRHQVRDLEDLCKSSSLSATARQLYVQEVSVLKHQQAHLAKKYSIEEESLEDIPKETIEVLQDGEVLDQPASDSDMSEPDQVPNGNSEPRGIHSAEGLCEEEDRNAESEEQNPLNTQAEGGDLNPNDVSERVAVAESAIEDFKAKIEALEPEIEKACEVENFDLAEDLESERKTLTQKLEDAQQELTLLRGLLSETDGPEKEEPQEEDKEPPEVEGELQKEDEAETRNEVRAAAGMACAQPFLHAFAKARGYISCVSSRTLRHITVIPLDWTSPDILSKPQTGVLQRWAQTHEDPVHAVAMLNDLPIAEKDVFKSRAGFLRSLRAMHWLHLAGAPAEELLQSWRLLESMSGDEVRCLLPCDIAETFLLLAGCCRPSTELVRHLNKQCRFLSRSFAADEVAQVLRAYGKLRFRSVQTVRLLTHRFGALLRDPDTHMDVKGSHMACVAGTYALLGIPWQTRDPFLPRELSMVSNAFAKIRAGPWAMPLLKAISARTMPQIDSYNEQDISNTLNAFAQLRARDPVLFDGAAIALLNNISSFAPQGLSLVAHAYAKLQFKHDALLDKIAATSIRLMDRFKPVHLGNLGYAFGRLQIQNKQLTLCLADEVIYRGTIGKSLQHTSDLYRFPLSPLERLAQAFARLSVQDQRLYFVLFDMTRQRVREFVGREEMKDKTGELPGAPTTADEPGFVVAPDGHVPSLSGHGLCILLSAFARSQSNFHSLVRWVPRQVTALQGQCSTFQLCNIFNSCSRLGIVNSPMYTELLSFAKSRVPQMSPRALAMLLRGMARAKVSDRNVIRSAVKVISAKLVELDVVDACALFVGCAEMNYRDARFIRLLASVVRARLSEISGSQLTTAFACYAHLRIQHYSWFDAILFELFQRQHELSEKDASNIAYGMLLLGAVGWHEQLARKEDAPCYPFDTHSGVLYSMLAISNEHRKELNYPAIYQLQIVELYLRLLEPSVYDSMRQELKSFLAKSRKVNVVVDDYMQNSSRLHRRISQWFTRVGLHHRSEVFLGPFMLDMVIGDRVVVEIDGPSHFYRDTNTRTASSLLKHILLSAMGFHVRHLPYQEWQQCGTAVKRTMYCSAFWKDVMSASGLTDPAGSSDARVPELVDILDLVLNWQSGQGPHPSVALMGRQLEPKRCEQGLPAFYDVDASQLGDISSHSEMSRSKFDVDQERNGTRSEQELLEAHAEAEAALEDDRQHSISSILRVRLDSRQQLVQEGRTDVSSIIPRSRRKVIRHSSAGIFDVDALEENTDDSSDEELEVRTQIALSGFQFWDLEPPPCQLPQPSSNQDMLNDRLARAEVRSVQERPSRGGKGVRAVVPARPEPADSFLVRGRGSRMYGGSVASPSGGLSLGSDRISAGSNPRASAFARAFDVEEQNPGPVRRVRGRRDGPYELMVEVDADYNGFPRYSQYDWDEPDWEHDQFEGPQTVGSAIFVRNLPPGVEGHQLKHLFEEAGQIANIQVDQGPLPTATIGYVRQGVAFDAAEMFHGRWLLGQELKVTVKAGDMMSTPARKVDDDFWRDELREMRQKGHLMRNDPWLMTQFEGQEARWVNWVPAKGKGKRKGPVKGDAYLSGKGSAPGGMRSALAWDD
ncbi:AL1 [Symbiodinium pilosum]|uniref:AL1 protein n=1 Tax=Symbiodinium pilosum TaxID=2952 RepID=A0A812L771_SYMPI|nr:AL1 [Symbiodinium pilosum]